MMPGMGGHQRGPVSNPSPTSGYGAPPNPWGLNKAPVSQPQTQSGGYAGGYGGSWATGGYEQQERRPGAQPASLVSFDPYDISSYGAGGGKVAPRGVGRPGPY